ncbi:hypothetical protein B0H13DRAFT_1864200 [Mycena leptocephala]|nr:hypothetical protein B0H13DRAFT_1864200 [Mycena leptocephala]
MLAPPHYYYYCYDAILPAVVTSWSASSVCSVGTWDYGAGAPRPASLAPPGRDFCFSFSVGACGITKRDQHHHQQHQQQQRLLLLLCGLRGHLDLKHPNNRKSGADYKHGGGAGGGREVAWQKHHDARLFFSARMHVGRHWAQMGVPPQMPKGPKSGVRCAAGGGIGALPTRQQAPSTRISTINAIITTASTPTPVTAGTTSTNAVIDTLSAVDPELDGCGCHQRPPCKWMQSGRRIGGARACGKYVLVRRLRAVVETSEVEKLRVRVGGREAKAKEACPQTYWARVRAGEHFRLVAGTMLASAIKRPRLGYWRPSSPSSGACPTRMWAASPWPKVAPTWIAVHLALTTPFRD